MRQLEDEVRLSKLLCPAYREMPVRNSFCPAPAITFSTVDRQSCRSAQRLELYADGFLHFYATDDSRPPIRRELERSQVEALRQLAADAKGEGLIGSDVVSTMLILGSSASEVREQVVSITGIPWPALRSSSNSCTNESREFPIMNIDR